MHKEVDTHLHTKYQHILHSHIILQIAPGVHGALRETINHPLSPNIGIVKNKAIDPLLGTY